MIKRTTNLAYKRLFDQMAANGGNMEEFSNWCRLLGIHPSEELRNVIETQLKQKSA